MDIILIVEDDRSIVKVITEFLSRKFVIEIIEAHGMQAGLILAEMRQPTLIILDLNLPDSLGIRTLEIFVQRNPHVPIVVITGDDRLAADSIKSGAIDYLSKPFTEKELCERVTVALAREKVKPIYEPIKEAIEGIKKVLSDSVNIQPQPR